MNDHELLDRARRELIREVVDQALAERASAAERQAAADLSKIRRAHLTPKQKSDLIDRIGTAAYLALEWDDPAPPRDEAGRFRSRW
jgi:hypothetical protein